MTYGRDLYCYDQVFTGRLVSGFDLLAQALFRRLTTPRGTLRGGEDEQIYGLDVLDFVGTVGTETAVAAIPDAVVAECLKDDRIERAEAKATIVRGTDGLVMIELDVDVFPHDEDTSAFTLSVSVSEVSVNLIGVTEI